MGNRRSDPLIAIAMCALTFNPPDPANVHASFELVKARFRVRIEGRARRLADATGRDLIDPPEIKPEAVSSYEAASA